MALYFHRLAFRPLLRAEAAGLYVRNVTDEHRVAWGEIEKITPGYYGLAIKLVVQDRR